MNEQWIGYTFECSVLVSWTGLNENGIINGIYFECSRLWTGSNENGQLIGRFCQTNAFLPPVIITPAQSLWIRFVSDMLFTQRGFQLVYNFTGMLNILSIIYIACLWNQTKYLS